VLVLLLGIPFFPLFFPFFLLSFFFSLSRLTANRTALFFLFSNPETILALPSFLLPLFFFFFPTEDCHGSSYYFPDCVPVVFSFLPSFLLFSLPGNGKRPALLLLLPSFFFFFFPFLSGWQNSTIALAALSVSSFFFFMLRIYRRKNQNTIQTLVLAGFRTPLFSPPFSFLFQMNYIPDLRGKRWLRFSFAPFFLFLFSLSFLSLPLLFIGEKLQRLLIGFLVGHAFFPPLFPPPPPFPLLFFFFRGKIRAQRPNNQDPGAFLSPFPFFFFRFSFPFFFSRDVQNGERCVVLKTNRPTPRPHFFPFFVPLLPLSPFLFVFFFPIH